MKALWALLFLPSLALAGPVGNPPGTQQTASSYTATLVGGYGFRLTQGTGICFNWSTCTQNLDADGDGLIYNVPTGDDHSFKVNSTDALVVGATLGTFAGALTISGALAGATTGAFSGAITSTVGSGSNAIAFSTAGARLDLGAGSTDYLTSNGSDTVTAAGVFRAEGGYTFGSGGLTTNNGGGQVSLQGNDQDDANANAAWVRNGTALTTDGAKVISFTASGAGSTTPVSSIMYTGEIAYNTGGSADVAGRAVLVGGTVTVSTTAVEADSIIQISNCANGGTPGLISVGTVTADTSFVINSASGTDTSTICWSIANQF